MAPRPLRAGYLLLLLTVPDLSRDALEAENLWVSLGPTGGTISSITISPHDPSVIYAGGSYGGAFKSTNAGAGWSPVNKGRSRLWLGSILAIDPKSPDTMYASMGTDVYKTINGGTSWIETELSTPLPSIASSGLIIDPRNPEIIYSCLGRGVQKSIDGGLSVNYMLSSVKTDFFVMDPQNPDALYAGGTEGDFLKSTDGGTTWTPFPVLFDGSGFLHLAIDPGNPAILYGIRMNDLFYKSTDGGTTWTQASRDLLWLDVSAFAVDPQRSLNLYAATTTAGVFKSTNGGLTWTAVNKGLTDKEVLSLSIDPRNATSLYVGTRNNGIFRSTDGAATWSAVNTGLTNLVARHLAIDALNPSTIYLVTFNGTFKSTNGGVDWNRVPIIVDHLTYPVDTLVVDPLHPSNVYATSIGAGLFKSTDGAMTWRSVTISIKVKGITCLAVDPRDPAMLYAGSSRGIFKSINAGESWIAVDMGSLATNINQIVVDPNDHAVIYAASSLGILKSGNGGASWTAIYQGGFGVAIDPTNSRNLYVRDVWQVFKSSDGGVNWRAVGAGLPDYFRVGSLVIDPRDPATMYTGDDSSYSRSGPYKTVDGGASWFSINGNLTDTSISCLAVNPQNPATLYVGTNGHGLFVTAPSTSNTLTLAPGGAATTTTVGPGGDVTAGYGSGAANSGSTPYATAVFSYTQNGVVVSEAGVPASPPTRSARFFVDTRTNAVAGSGGGTITVLTGFAAVNPNTVPTTLNLKLRDGSGASLAQGSIPLGRGQHIAKFLDQLTPNFVLPAGFINSGLGSVEITSDQPVSLLALRLTVNQRGDLLLTTTPVADLTRAAPTGPLAFPQIADGGGYQTTIILMNTSGALETGVIRLYGNSGSPLAVRLTGGSAADSRFSYSIAPGAILRLVTDATPSAVNVGWAQLTPDAGTAAPVSAAVFGFTQRGVLVTESGVPAVSPTTHARIYVDMSGGHDTGLAVANPGSSGIRITATAYKSDGVTRAGTGSGPLDLPSLGHDARFAAQMISGLPERFTGVMDLAASTPFTALTLRSLTNGRGDFLITTFPVADVNQPPPTPLIFPQIASGGGYQTQFILLSTGGAASSITLSYFGNDGGPVAIGSPGP